MELQPLNKYDFRKLLVSPSVLAADFAKLGEEVQNIEKNGAAWVHLDIMDGHFVPNLTIGPAVVAKLRSHTTLPFDVHLMITNPLDYVQPFAKAGSDHITFHIESDSDTGDTIRAIHEAGCSAGLTLKPGTPAETLLPWLEQIEMVLVMTVEPGFGGQKFMRDQLEKVRMLQREREKRGLRFHIEVDGGLDASNVAEAAAAGANAIVAGTSVFRCPDGVKSAIDALCSAEPLLPQA